MHRLDVYWGITDVFEYKFGTFTIFHKFSIPDEAKFLS